MLLSEIIAWTIVELQAKTPDAGKIVTVLEQALCEAIKLNINHDLKVNTIIRLAKLADAPNDETKEDK